MKYMDCNKCKKLLDRKKSIPVLWKEGDEGLKYKWNKICEISQYVIICEHCKTENHWMPMS